MISFKRFKLFGINLLLPAIARIHKKLDHDRAALLHGYKAEMADCVRCHRYIDAKAGTSFLLHMQKDHQIAEGDSYRIVEQLWRNMLVANRNSRSTRELN